MTNQAGKGSRRRKRDDRYCTAEQEAENYERALGKSSHFPKIAPEPTKAKRTSRVRSTVFDENAFHPYAAVPPDAPVNWCEFTEEQLLVKKCCYWFLPDETVTENTSTIRVRIPRANLVTPKVIRDIMDGIREGKIL